MKIITFPTHKTALYMGQKIELPLWVNYIAVYPNLYGSNSSSLIGFSHKPILKPSGIWTISHKVKNPRQEEIGIIRNFKPKRDEVLSTLSEVLIP